MDARIPRRMKKDGDFFRYTCDAFYLSSHRPKGLDIDTEEPSEITE